MLRDAIPRVTAFGASEIALISVLAMFALHDTQAAGFIVVRLGGLSQDINRKNSERVPTHVRSHDAPPHYTSVNCSGSRLKVMGDSSEASGHLLNYTARDN